MKKICSLIVAGFCFLVCMGSGLVYAGESYPLVIEHKSGSLKLAKTPARVVVMDFGMLDSIDELVQAGAVSSELKLALPKGNLPSYLAKYESEEYLDVGGLKDFNLEIIFGFKPDLIIISGRQQDFYKELSSIAPVWQVDSLPSSYIEGVSGNIRNLGRIFSAEAAVEESLNRLGEEINSVRKKAAALDLNALVLLTNDGKISAYGSGSRFGIIHDALGLKEADRQIKVGIHGQLVNYEYIAQINPDIIFVVDRSIAVTGKADGVRILDNELVNGTNAAKNGRIVPLDPNVWYLSGGGLQSLRMMVRDIDDALEK